MLTRLWLACWSVAAILATLGTLASNLGPAQMLWALAGILVVWVLGVLFTFIDWDS